MFTTHQTARAKQECDFSILGRNQYGMILCAEDEILEHKNVRKMILNFLFTVNETYIIDWVVRFDHLRAV